MVKSTRDMANWVIGRRNPPVRESEFEPEEEEKCEECGMHFPSSELKLWGGKCDMCANGEY